MHTKKTNNTNKLMQIKLPFCLYKNSKITKLKKKKFLSVSAGNAQNQPIWLVFKPVRNIDISILVYVPVWYIPTNTGTILTILIWMHILHHKLSHFAPQCYFIFNKILLHVISIRFFLKWNKLKRPKHPSSKSIKTKPNFFTSLSHECFSQI